MQERGKSLSMKGRLHLVRPLHDVIFALLLISTRLVVWRRCWSTLPSRTESQNSPRRPQTGTQTCSIDVYKGLNDSQGNVLIDDSGNPRICDFGLVHIFLEEEHTGLTTTSVHTGTDRYLAPELLSEDGERPSTASDVWALGCIGLEVRFLSFKLGYFLIVKLVPVLCRSISTQTTQPNGFNIQGYSKRSTPGLSTHQYRRQDECNLDNPRWVLAFTSGRTTRCSNGVTVIESSPRAGNGGPLGKGSMDSWS